MEHEAIATKWGVLIGICGGMGNYLLQAGVEASYLVKLVQAGTTALVCGLLGAAGKYAFDLLRKQFTKYKPK